MELIFYIIAGIIILFFLGIVGIKLFEKPVNRSKQFVLNNLKKIVDKKDGDTEFDDFICVPISNKRFEEMRKYCCELTENGVYSNYSETEKETVMKYISELEGSN